MEREMVLTFKATEELDRMIEMTAQRQECSKAAIIRQALNEYFSRRTPSAQVPPVPEAVTQ
jgi:predicted transcriptional regulator